MAFGFQLFVYHSCFWIAQDLTRYYRCNFICDCCFANRALPWLNSGDFSKSARWRSTYSVLTEDDSSRWLVVPGYHKERCLWDGALSMKAVTRMHVAFRSCSSANRMCQSVMHVRLSTKLCISCTSAFLGTS